MTYWERFENLCGNIEKKPNPVGKEIGVSSSTITKWKNGAIPNGEILLKVANYFNCSIDYLLGRTDEPKICTSNSVKTGDINGNNSGNFTFGTFTRERQKDDSIRQEFLLAFDNLDFIEKMEIMNAVLEKTKK